MSSLRQSLSKLKPAALRRSRWALGPFDQSLDASKHAFEKHRLRASVAAPEPTLDRGDDQQAEPDSAQQEEHEPEVLRVEHGAEQIEAAIHDVDEHRRMPSDLDERQDDVDRDQDREDDVTEPVKRPFTSAG